MEAIRSLAQIGKEDTVLAGGKGASLGEMVRVGFPVPPGFVVLTSAFERFLHEAGLRASINSVLAGIDRDDFQSIEAASWLIRERIVSTEIPDEIAREISRCFEQLGAAYVAVRSSATAEDSANATWAGQLESYLNTTEKDLIENIKKCWASLFAPRALSYGLGNGVLLQEMSMAVVVQCMIESDVAGVAFSVHPVTHRDDELVIEAGFGLGEAVVSGQITPDNYVVRKAQRQVHALVNTQTRGLFRGVAGGCEWRKIPEPQASSQALEDADVLDLADLVILVERHYGFPCDVEWVLKDGKLYIVQARAITGLAEHNPEEDK